MRSYKQHFRRFLNAAPDRLHFAAHSHHLWPDVTYDAHMRAWEDAARLADRKWDHILGAVTDGLAERIAGVLGLSDGSTIVFGTSTHFLVLSVLSGIERGSAPLRVLTTDGEFHSFRRQSRRLEEAGRMTLEVVPVEPFDTFTERFTERVRKGNHQLVYLSQVMFDSGFVVPDLDGIVTAAREETVVVVDGYHGFLAVPTDLSGVRERAFYVTGGYKYAMSGEGVCFLHAPPGYCARPIVTGWFAGFSGLTGPNQGVSYGEDASRFAGATFDPSGLYRMTAVLDLLRELGLGVEAIHARVRALQKRFLGLLDEVGLDDVSTARLIPGADAPDRGNFVTFRTERAGKIHAALARRGVVTDFRADRLRFGFGVYHDPGDVDELVSRLGQIDVT